MNTSRYLAHLDKRAREAKTFGELQRVASEKAIYFSRGGHGDLAAYELVQLRQRATEEPSAKMSTWWHLAQAVYEYYSDNLAQAIDQSTRAKAVCEATGFTAPHATSLAWLAHFADDKHDVQACADYARKSLRLAEENDYLARIRVALTVAANLGFGGRADLADRWYSIAKAHAQSIGDELTIAAAASNRATQRFYQLRQEVLSDAVGANSVKSVLAEISATSNLENWLKSQAFPHFPPLLTANALSLSGKRAEALHMYEPILSEQIDLRRHGCHFLADFAYCLAISGDVAKAETTAHRAVVAMDRDTHPDDEAATVSRLADAMQVLGKSEVSAQYRARSLELWANYRSVQLQICAEFEGITESG